MQILSEKYSISTVKVPVNMQHVHRQTAIVIIILSC